MLRIIGTDIHLTKGDSAYFNVSVVDTLGKPYEYEDGDTITMTVRKVLDNSLIFQKTVKAGTCIVVEPEDTNKANVGKHKYDVELKTVEGNIYTVIPKSDFCLEEEVTYEQE